MMQELTRVVQLRFQTLVSFVAAGQILLGTGLEVGFVPAGATEAETRHGQHLLELWCLARRAVDQRCCADLLNGFQLMTTGSTLIVVHRHGVVSAIRLLPHTLGFAAKSGIISIKCGLCSRKTAQAGAALDPRPRSCVMATVARYFWLCTTHTTRTNPLKFFTPP